MVEGISVSGFGLENIPSERYIFSCEELELPPVLENGSDIVVLACKSHVVPELSRLATTLLTEDGIVRYVDGFDLGKYPSIRSQIRGLED